MGEIQNLQVWYLGYNTGEVVKSVQPVIAQV